MSIPPSLPNHETGMVPITQNHLLDMLSAFRAGIKAEIRDEMQERTNDCWRAGQRVQHELEHKISAQTGKFNQLATVCEAKTKEVAANCEAKTREIEEACEAKTKELEAKLQQERAESAAKFASQEAKITRQDYELNSQKGNISTLTLTCQALAKQKEESDIKIQKMSEMNRLKDDLLEAQKRSKTAENNATTADLEWKVACQKAKAYQEEAEAAESNPEMDDETKKTARDRANTYQRTADEAKAKSEQADAEFEKAKMDEIKKKRQALMTESGGKVAGAVIGLAGSIAVGVGGVFVTPVLLPVGAGMVATGYAAFTPSVLGVIHTSENHQILKDFLRDNPMATECDVDGIRAEKDYARAKQERWDDSQKRWEEAKNPKQEEEPGYTSGRYEYRHCPR